MAESNKAPPQRRLPAFTEKYHHDPYDFISPRRSELSVTGKNVVVTGGGTGIGKSIAVAFAQAGAKSVAILGRRSGVLESAVKEIEKAATGSGAQIFFEVVDLCSKEQTVGALASVKSKVGLVDIFVSNAATDPGRKPVEEQTAEDLIRTFELNCVTGLHALQALIGVASKEPVVLNVSSVAAHASGPSGGLKMSTYAITKAASLKLFISFAMERPDIHVVHLHPGFVWSEMTEPHFPREACPDDPDLAGQFCLWLASPEARFLKNKYVHVNWDAEELLKRADEIKNSNLLIWSISGLGF
ncbi:NAD(P)-binding protein [Thozetella sp. PMI_491]|nr:NAD(P)-binding protein [Thozetella sp. PMI_491]